MSISIYDRDKTIQLFDGRQCRYKHAVGWCDNMTHIGFMTYEMLCEHECIDKECPYLVKHNHAFWDYGDILTPPTRSKRKTKKNYRG